MLVKVRTKNRIPFELPTQNFRFQLTPELHTLLYSHPKESAQLQEEYRCFSSEDLLQFVIENGGHMAFLKLILKKIVTQPPPSDQTCYYRLIRDTFQLVKTRKAIRLISEALLKKQPDLSLPMLMRTAVYFGKCGLVKLLLKYKLADPNYVYSKHVSLLTLAVSNVQSADHMPDPQGEKRVIGDTGIIKALLDAGARVDGTAPVGTHCTPLLWCMRTKRSRLPLTKKLKVVKQLLDAGANVNARTPWGHTALVTAIYRTKSVRLCGLLLDAGANTDGSLQAALYTDVNYNLLRLLLQHGARLEPRAEEHRNPVLYLFGSGCKKPLPKLKLLHEHGCSLRHALRLAVYCDIHCFKEVADYILQFECIHERDEVEPGFLDMEMSYTKPLLECALKQAGTYDYVTRERSTLRRHRSLLHLLQLLLQHGVNINETTGKKGILAVAAKYQTYMIPHLIQTGVDLQRDSPKSAMHYLLQKMRNQSEIRAYYYSEEEYKYYIQLLLDHGFTMTEQCLSDSRFECLAISQFVEYKFQSYFRQLFRRLVLPLIPVQASRVKLKDVNFVAQMVQAKYSGETATSDFQSLLRQKFGVDSLTRQQLKEWTG